MTPSTVTLGVRIARKEAIARDIVLLELASATGDALPAFSAGAHIDVHLPGGLTRQYSLCNPPWETQTYVIAVLHTPDSRGGSRAVHETLDVGDKLTIGSPRNHFPLTSEAGKVVLLAGGIGVTPLLGMAEQLARDGCDFEFHYSARSTERMAFREQLRDARYGRRVHQYFDDCGPRLDLPALLAEPSPDTHLYVCGPSGLIDAALATARRLGWSEAQLHHEFFNGAAANIKSASFEVELARSGRIIPVNADQSIVGALAAQGLQIPVSCEQGVCGTCLTHVVSGHPDHRDVYLTHEEQVANDRMLPCCSRSLTPRLVLDL